MNIKKHIDNGVKTYFQNIGGTYNVASAVPQNLFRTMFAQVSAPGRGGSDGQRTASDSFAATRRASTIYSLSPQT
jgi:hypothetical protein